MSYPSPLSTPEAHARDARLGVVAALVCYLVWGFLPLFFSLLQGVASPTIVAHRTIWSAVMVGLVLVATARFAEVGVVFRDWRKLGAMAASAALLGFNWLMYVWSVESAQVLESSLGYFINPLVNVAIGMVLLGERQNRWQTLAILIAGLAIAVQWIAIGRIPYIALSLAFSFGFYGYVRKIAHVSPLTGLFVETLVMLPVALAYLGYTVAVNGPGPHADPYKMALLVMAGPITAIPLIAFAFAVRRLRYTTIGMFQYLAPTLQFLVAVLVFGEVLTPLRLLSFALIWLSLAVFTADSFYRYRGALAQRREAQPEVQPEP